MDPSTPQSCFICYTSIWDTLYNHLTIASFRIEVHSILFFDKSRTIQICTVIPNYLPYPILSYLTWDTYLPRHWKSLMDVPFTYCYLINWGPLHVLWQVSFGFWVTWSISSCVFFPHAEWWVAELLFLSLNIWGLNFLQNECSQSSQIYLSPEKLRKMFTFQSCKFLNDKIKLSSAK